MKKTTLLVTAILNALLFSFQISFAQCKQEPNPDKWLFRPMGINKGDEIPGPDKFEYATAIKSLFYKPRSYQSVYSFTKSNGEYFLNMTIGVNDIPMFKFTPSNYVTFYVPGKEPLTLHPTTEYPCFGGNDLRYTVCFFKLTKEDVECLAHAAMDSLIFNYTILPDEKKDIPAEKEKSITIDDMGTNNREEFMEFAKCFLEQF